MGYLIAILVLVLCIPLILMLLRGRKGPVEAPSDPSAYPSPAESRPSEREVRDGTGTEPRP